MFYKKRIEALEERVTKLEIKVASLMETTRAQLAGPQNPLPEPKPKQRRRRRKTNGKETTTTNE